MLMSLKGAHLKIQRLHIGAKNLIDIHKVSWEVLSQKSWIHLGTEKPDITSIKKPQIQIKKSSKQRFNEIAKKADFFYSCDTS